ncbi:LSU ribosomal protein L40E Ubiquitin [Ecytonucleospora hepatopenaei]|uniref:LSU ribosomal protein L40E Ubiquitin n=1 Tax=Ecytonucleospora hepatopenaei TaxID=646526 RepID=A0A1W0E587_9MICR|nr:LSU ribosomal protein L40E Ubiquitin [Ecytonucleospora hepatopenaei]
MYIFITTHNGTICRSVTEHTTVSDINESIREYGCELRNTCLIDNYNNIKISMLPSTFFTAAPLLLGGGNMTETNKMLALQQLKVKICRRCYANNAAKATRCRKAQCGHYGDLRMKKVLK